MLEIVKITLPISAVPLVEVKTISIALLSIALELYTFFRKVLVPYKDF